MLLDATQSPDGYAFLVADGELLMVVRADVAKSQIATRIASRFAQQPSLLHELEDRLANETAEDWEPDSDGI
jgi:hypothetical protein